MRRDVETERSPSEDAATTSEDEKWLRCAACGERVAPERAHIAVNGARTHDFMNPSGIRFRVACLREAPGCVADGALSTVWTWFPGFAWQVALCRSCGVHLGWSFHGATVFYGLVVDRLV